MFTGIIEEVGQVSAWEPTADAARITITAPLAVTDVKHGDSISVSGVCLTVVDQGDDWFTADVMAESIEMSTLADIQPGDRVNLERAAKVGDRIGGHIVQGHIDGTAEILSATDGSAWRVLRLTLHRDLAPLVARKGSIAIDGISLTVSAVGDDWFEVSLIPETLEATTLGSRGIGDLVNIETDILARQVQRMLLLGDTAAGGDHDGRSSVSPPPQRIGFSAGASIRPSAHSTIGSARSTIDDGASTTALHHDTATSTERTPS
jgi:riboflavin synthase